MHRAWWLIGNLASNWTRRDTLFSSHSFHHNTQAQHPHSGATASTLHPSHTIDPESNTRRFMGSMPAIQPYKNYPQRAIIHEVRGLNAVGCSRSKNSMAHQSTPARPNPDLIAGGGWARRQLPNGIKDVFLASELMKSLTLVTVVFIGTLAIPALYRRSLHNQSSDPESDCGVLFISNNNTWHSVHSVHQTPLMLECKSRTRTQPPYHTTHLTQPDAAPNPQDAPDTAPNTQDAT